MLPIRSYLFVPATRIDRVAKAHASGADAVIIDLEDAVSFEQKDAARQDLLTYDNTATHHYWLRINTFGENYEQDLALINQLKHIHGIVLPKVNDHHTIAQTFDHTNLPIIALIESVQGWRNLEHIASSAGVFALSFGALDLSHELGLVIGTDGADIVLNRLRTDLVIQSKLHGLRAPIDSIYADFQDDDGLVVYAKRWHEMGFSGQLCIHPKQIQPIHQSIRPKDDVLKFCHKVIDYFEKTGEFAFAIDGQMVDLPVIERAKAVIDSMHNTGNKKEPA